MPPAPLSTAKDLFRTYAQRLWEEIQRILPHVPNETEFRQRVDWVWEEFCRKAGITELQRAEYTLASGRVDALFARFVVEYKRPGSLADSLSHPTTRQAVEQLKRYLQEIAAKKLTFCAPY